MYRDISIMVGNIAKWPLPRQGIEIASPLWLLLAKQDLHWSLYFGAGGSFVLFAKNGHKNHLWHNTTKHSFLPKCQLAVSFTTVSGEVSMKDNAHTEHPHQFFPFITIQQHVPDPPFSCSAFKSSSSWSRARYVMFASSAWSYAELIAGSISLSFG